MTPLVIPHFGPVSWRIGELPAMDLGPLQLGAMPVSVDLFGVLVLAGFALGGLLATGRARRVGQDVGTVRRLVLGLVVAGFVGGKLGHALFYVPDWYLRHPLRLLAVWKGLSSIGGFIACAAFTVVYLRRRGLPVLPHADTLCASFPAGFALGRLGCFAAHDHPGLPSDSLLAVAGICPTIPPTGTACLDLGLCEALYVAGLAVVFAVMDRRPRQSGFFLALLMIGYAPGRFVLDGLRHPAYDPRFLGLTPAQHFSILLFSGGLLLVFRLRKRWNASPSPNPIGSDG